MHMREKHFESNPMLSIFEASTSFSILYSCFFGLVAVLHFNVTLPFIYLHLLPECFSKLNILQCLLFSIWWMFITVIHCSEKCTISQSVITLHYPWGPNHFTVIKWICFLEIISVGRKGKGNRRWWEVRWAVVRLMRNTPFPARKHIKVSDFPFLYLPFLHPFPLVNVVETCISLSSRLAWGVWRVPEQISMGQLIVLGYVV